MPPREFLETLKANPTVSLESLRRRLGVGHHELQRWKTDPEIPWFADELAAMGKTRTPESNAKRAVSKAQAWGITDEAFNLFVEEFERSHSWIRAEEVSGISRGAVMARVRQNSPLYDAEIAAKFGEAENTLLADTESKLFEIAKDGDPRVLQFILESRDPVRWDRGGRHQLAKQRAENKELDILTSRKAHDMARLGLASVIESFNAAAEKKALEMLRDGSIPAKVSQ